ncbi:MAG: Rap1a/Tai family immunity protein [Rhodospirillales bacterium]
MALISPAATGAFASCAALVLAAATAAAGTPAISTQELTQVCRVALKTGNVEVSNTARAVCMSYLDAVVATVNQISVLVSPDGGNRPPFIFCVPPQKTDLELTQIFVQFADRNPQHVSVAAAAIASAAFADAFPCR